MKLYQVFLSDEIVFECHYPTIGDFILGFVDYFKIQDFTYFGSCNQIHFHGGDVYRFTVSGMD